MAAMAEQEGCNSVATSRNGSELQQAALAAWVGLVGTTENATAVMVSKDADAHHLPDLGAEGVHQRPRVVAQLRARPDDVDQLLHFTGW